MAQILAHACANPHTTMARINLIPSRTVQIALAAILSGAATMAPAQEKTDGWPLVFSSGDDQVQVFKPQPETFDGTSFTARAAVAVQRKQDASPVFGAVWGNGTLAVDRTSRVGKLTAFKVTDVRFPGITDTAEQLRIKTMLSDGILAHAPPIDLDWMVAALEEEKKSDSSYDNAPPEIIYRNKPSMLLYVDGDPIYEKVKNTANGNSDGVYAANGPAVERVVNTPFFLVRTEGKEYWLYGSGLWYKASDFKGPWKDERRAPEYLERLAAKVDTSFKADKNEKHDIIPDVVVTTKPAVLLDVNGAPQMQPYDNSSLMYVTNTDKDLFMDIPTQEYYFLASGRWYATKDLQNGPWRYVAADALPAEFAKVPEGSAKDGILAHVAGTPAAREAVRDASIPQTAQVNRNSVNLTVNYDGSPQFRTIPGTSITAATNASTTVLLINGVYHVCDNAVWYEGNSPDGPWVVSTSVPAQVNDIPPSDPAYRVRYVYIYDYTPDVVYIGYTPGYLGSYVQSGVVIYGTGYYYNPWRGAYWYPRPYTWGFNMYYNPWYGWGFGGGWGFDWFYPSWNYYGYYRPYAWGWWGPYAYCPPSYGYWHGYGNYNGHYNGNGYYYGHRPGMAAGNPGLGRAGSSAALARSTNLYDNHRLPGITPAQVGRPFADRAAGNTARGTMERNNGQRGTNAERRDYFTDRQGNVYRSEQGRTEELRDGRWNAVARPENREPRPGGTGTMDRSGATQPARGAGSTNWQNNGGMDRNGATQQQRQPVPSTSQPDNSWRDRQAAPERAPQMERNNNPWMIQQERTRGDQRVNDFRGWQEDRGGQRQMEAPRMERSAPSMGGRSGGGGGFGGGGGGGTRGGGGGRPR